MKKSFLPISIEISGQKILIVGGGQSAFKKLELLKQFNAEIKVVALTVCDEIKRSGVEYREKEYDKNDLQGCLMVYSCTNDKEVDKQIVKDARESGVLVNIHDQPGMCQFISPAIFQYGQVTVAVSSNGRDVSESIRVRDIIKNYLQPEFY
ncbi:MAG: bifunctional precorrin-2 dehydrogenase/sirohydrochlorin ferrochelatase [Chlorobi bacterium]|nr:bifunctional precorrin-2 dehydrogenase/sirohydrochlorin ferrochelatase [Chlorobiota bacterium]